jgi:enoyl-CoA hydratase/carnithine racemase
MLGERIDPERLQQLGVVHAVCPQGSALEGTLALCERLNGRAPTAIASIKELVNEAQQTTLHQQLDHERDHFVRNLHHANGGEGIAAFLAKRTAHYR